MNGCTGDCHGAMALAAGRVTLRRRAAFDTDLFARRAPGIEPDF